MKRLYDVAGTRPLTDDELAEAIRQYRVDHPEQAKRGTSARIVRLNDEARERAEAEAAGLSVSALRTARAEMRAEDRAARDKRELERARVWVRDPGPSPMPRGGVDLTRAEILAHRRAWLDEGSGLREWERAGATKSTFIRHRHRHGLVPWPRGYDSSK